MAQPWVVKHLLVDLDGTLLGNRSVPLQLDFVAQALRTLKKYGGLRKRIRALLGVQEALRTPSKDVTNDKRAIEVFSRLMEIPQEQGRQLLRESLAVIFPSLERHFFPVPGARDFLLWAKDRFPMTLASNPVWPKEVVELRLRWAGVDPGIFRAITLANQMHACKPELQYYEEVLALAAVSAEDCLLIGDDVKMDLPATRLGIRVFIVDSDGKPDGIAPLKVSGAKAPAWKGGYSALRRLLEESAGETVR